MPDVSFQPERGDPPLRPAILARLAAHDRAVTAAQALPPGPVLALVPLSPKP